MGDTGPCVPCSYIFYDHGEDIPGGPPGSPEGDGDRFIEVWNLVFMQYEQLPGGKRVDLPRPSIDTGMGLERIAAVLQGTHDNYRIDLFGAIIMHVADLTGVEPEGPRGVSHRVIADHLRASAFLIADGVLPSNEGRGYVLRRIMRRGMRHAELLGAREPLMWKLVPTLTREMGQAYPELHRAQALITETLRLEETRFRRTLERGLGILEEESRGLKSGDKLKGETAFTLYDTYGFPLDLTQDALKARGIQVDLVRRSMIRGNHSATHLLHEALRTVLGDHVAQKGSLVAPDRLRFDFSHPKPMDEKEIAQVEDIANAVVLQNKPVITRLMALEDARSSGARALFGEKYGEEVRVVA